MAAPRSSTLCIVIGLYRILSRPRPVGVPPAIAALAITVIGAFLNVSLIGVEFLPGTLAMLGILASVVAGPLFLLGLGLVVLRDPALQTE